jgi:hypothetical protein
MKKILFIVSEYYKAGGEEEYYPFFLKESQRILAEYDYQMQFLAFGNQHINAIDEGSYLYKNEYSGLSNDEIKIEALRIEREYEFTLKQAFYPDILQVSKFQNNRLINIPEIEFKDSRKLVSSFLYLEKILKDDSISICLCDQCPEYLMEFGRAICFKLEKIFLRCQDGFMGRSNFVQQYDFGKERVVEAVFNSYYSEDDAKNFIRDYIDNKRAPYIRQKPYRDEIGLNKKIKKNLKKIFSIEIFKYCIKLIKNTYFCIFNLIENKIFKKFIEDQFIGDSNYLFFGFHLTTESTMGLRSLPYLNQNSLIESISRVLPSGVNLYVREHPHWPSHFSFLSLLKLKSLSNVRLISAAIPIDEVIKGSKGILTYNATTGIEALIYKKPVLSFSPNTYFGHHPSVFFCSDLFQLGYFLQKLVNTSVDDLDTVKYIRKMFCITNDVLINSNLFFSKNDAKKKARTFSNHLYLAIEWCKSK